MPTIQSLKNASFDTVFTAFNQAFDDYEIQLNKVELERMLKRRGYVPELSFGAFDKDVLVSFTLNGIGNFNGTKTAYDTGTGTIKAYRGQGLATQIFQYSVPFLKEAGVGQYLLEVLQHNEKAVSIYRKQGFKVSREFNYFVQEMSHIHFRAEKDASDLEYKTVPYSTIEACTSFHDFEPSWQNNYEAIQRTPDDYIVIAAYNAQVVVGYCVFEPLSGDITQLAVDIAFRRKGIATELLKQALMHNQHGSAKLINAEVDCEAITSFMASVEIPVCGQQFEMIKKL